jgi:hypothetical protein
MDPVAWPDDYRSGTNVGPRPDSQNRVDRFPDPAPTQLPLLDVSGVAPSLELCVDHSRMMV